MVPKKRATKRLTLKKKYRILKNAKESKRKKKRDMKRNPEKYQKKKDPGIPLKLPFYKQVVDDLQQAKENHERRIEEAKQRRKEQKNLVIAPKRKLGDFSVDELIKRAKTEGEDFDLRESEKENEGNDALKDKSARAYYREFKKVVEAADVVLEVLDARDPLGTRVTQLESVVNGQMGKKLVLILNKADLVPRENLEKWLKFLRQEYPTVVFKSSTQTQGQHIGQTKAKIMKINEDVMHTSKCLGADVLMQLLKNYCRNKDIKTAITVGVVGLPNVGKSSLINSLKRAKSCGVGATPGFTKSMQEVTLDSKVKLLDCPGIVLPGKDTDNATAALRNAIKLEDLADPYTPVDAILAKADKDHIMIHYRLPAFQTTDDFLCTLAKRFGKLKKGGVPDREAAARKLLYDWNTGVIKYYTQPPAITESQVSSALVQKLSDEFDIDSLKVSEGCLLQELPNHRPSKIMKITSFGPVVDVMEHDGEESEDEMDDGDNDDDDNEEDDEMEQGGDDVESSALLGKDVCIKIDTKQPEEKKTEKKPRWETEHKTFDPETMSLEKFGKKMSKKARKEKNRNEKRIDGLALNFDSLNCEKPKEDYDFDEYFK